MLTRAIGPPGLDAALARTRERGHDPGPVRSMSRRAPDGTVPRWRLTGAGPGAVPDPLPFLIDWGGSRHPAASGPPVAPLPAVSARAADPEAVRDRPAALGTSLPLTAGPAALSFTLDTPNGPVTFG